MTYANRIIVSGPTLTLCPSLAKNYGKSAALILQQLHYWLSKQDMRFGIVENGCQWIRNSYKQWQEQIPHLSLSTIRRAFAELERQKIILSKTVKGVTRFPGGDQVKYFTINYDNLETSFGNLSQTIIHRPGCSSINQYKKVAKENNLGANENLLPTIGKMNTLHAQNEHPPLYITKTTSEKLNNKSEQTTQLHFLKLESDKSKQVEEGCKNNLILDLVEIWNQTVEEGRDPILLNKKRAQYLAAAYKQKFESSSLKLIEANENHAL